MSATAGTLTARLHTAMREIVIDQGWRDRAREIVIRRKDQWPLVALVAGVALVALLWSGRTPPARIAPPATAPAVQASPSPAEVVLVHVAGAVRRPGLYEFPSGARVADAVESAGGPRRRADLDALNLAEVLVDGTRIEVVRVGESPVATAAGTSAAGSGLISLNTADQALLETIPGIGPVTAAAILGFREEIGGFDSLEQLLEVDGIGPATFGSIRDHLTL